MYDTVLFIHSYWAYLVLLILIVATVNSLVGYFADKEYGATNFRIALFTLIVSHIMLIIGFVLYFVSPKFAAFSGDEGMGGVMANDEIRFSLIEHPLMMLIAVVLITIGYSKHKKKLTSKPKFKMLAIFYTLGLIFILSRIPWSNWF